MGIAGNKKVCVVNFTSEVTQSDADLNAGQQSGLCNLFCSPFYRMQGIMGEYHSVLFLTQ